MRGRRQLFDPSVTRAASRTPRDHPPVPPPIRRRIRERVRARARQRDSELSECLARLIEAPDTSTLLSEASRGARTLAKARESEILVWPHRSRRKSPLPGRRSRARSQLERDLRQVRGGNIVVHRKAGRVSYLMPLRHGRRSLGCIQLSWDLDPSHAVLEALESYLTRVGATLERRLFEERLQRQQRRHEALLDSFPDACLLILSPACRVLGVRGHAQALVGPDPAVVLGQPLVGQDGRSGLLRLSRSRLRQLLATARRNGKAQTETCVGAFGREVEVQMTLACLSPRGELVCILRDLTEVKAMERALLRRNEELTQAAERLKEIDVLKNEFLSNVSHELRTPLTAIIAYSEALLLSPPEPATQKDFLRVVAEQGHKLQRLITGLLDIAKLESLATELKLLPASLNDIVRSAVVTVQPLADKSQIRIEMTLAPELPEAYLDELRSQQIVWNLLTNAIKFSPPASSVHVQTWVRDGKVWASVRDEGIGIAPEHQHLIFEKFVQVDGSTTRRHGGVGLGLDLVRHLVELHGGHVGVESQLGHGATFFFGIPLEKRSRPRLGEVRPMQAAATGRRS